jgi:hypothetical protein
MGEVARHLLVAGAHLLYGGDLRPGGCTELLLELVARHRPEAGSDKMPAVVTNYLPWPVHMSLTPAEFAKWTDGIGSVAELVCLGRDGGIISAKRRAKINATQPIPDDWSHGLSSMRKALTKLSAARVILGGRVEGYKGKMPGIAEEALTLKRASQSSSLACLAVVRATLPKQLDWWSLVMLRGWPIGPDASPSARST